MSNSVSKESESPKKEQEVFIDQVTTSNEEVEENKDYSSLTVAEIKSELDSRGIIYPSTAKKVDLITLLEEDDNKEIEES